MVAPAGYQASGIGTPVVAGAVTASGYSAPAIGAAIVAGAVTALGYDGSGIGTAVVSGPIIVSSHESPPAIGTFSVIQVVTPSGLDASGIGTGLITIAIGAVGYQNPGIGVPYLGGSQQVTIPSYEAVGIGGPIIGSSLAINVAPLPAAAGTRCYLFYPESATQTWTMGTTTAFSGLRHSFMTSSGLTSSSTTNLFGEFDFSFSIGPMLTRPLTSQGYGEFFVAFTSNSDTYEVILRQRGTSREAYFSLPQGSATRIHKLDFSDVSVRLGQDGLTISAGRAKLVQQPFISAGSSSITMGARASSASITLAVDSFLKPAFSIAGKPLFALEDLRPYYTFEVPPGLGRATLRAALYGRAYTTDFTYIDPSSTLVSSDRKVYQL